MAGLIIFLRRCPRLGLHVERLRDLLDGPDEGGGVGRARGRAALGGAHGQRRRHVGRHPRMQRLLRRLELSSRILRGDGEQGAGLGVVRGEDGLRGARRRGGVVVESFNLQWLLKWNADVGECLLRLRDS